MECEKTFRFCGEGDLAGTMLKFKNFLPLTLKEKENGFTFEMRA
jgi:hypothetical protein